MPRTPVFTEFEFSAAHTIPSNVRAVSILGVNNSVGPVEASVSNLGQNIFWPTVASKISVSSTSALDSTTGTGARSVRVYGLNENYVSIFEDINLQGQTPTYSVGKFIRTRRAEVQAVGSLNSNAGSINVGVGTVVGGVPAVLYLRMLPTHSRTFLGGYTVPAKKLLYLRRINILAVPSNNKTVDFRLRRRKPECGFITVDQVTLSELSGQVYLREEFTFPLPERTDIEFLAKSAQGQPAFVRVFALGYLIDTDGNEIVTEEI